jgi:tetratricopeptide (TPR) repeat protein
MKKGQFGSSGGATPFGRRQRKAETAAPMGANDLESVFGQGRALHGIGHLAEAEKIYRQVLKAQPNHRDSLYLLGVVHYQGGRYEEAVRQFDAAS